MSPFSPYRFTLVSIYSLHFKIFNFIPKISDLFPSDFFSKYKAGLSSLYKSILCL